MKLGKSLLLWGALALSWIVITSCSRNHQITNDSSLKVDPSLVKSILIGSASELEPCESDIKKRQGTILFRGDSGVLMTDLPKESISSSQCQVPRLENEKIQLPERVKEDLSTLLRLIPAEEIGARSFVKANPTFDGRQTVVAVLDTGVEFMHPLLTSTSTGAPKVINVADFSGEGRVILTAQTPTEGNTVDVAGKSHSIEGLNGTDYFVGQFLGSSLKYSEDVAELDEFSDIGVVTYLKDGKRYTRVDTNANLTFSDDVELANFKETRTSAVLGKKGVLHFAVQISDDGSVVTLHFDDGSHGTHVAGIAAGYSADLVGVAPGAQVISAKIGDNRLSGGSTTTASMMLAIDWAIKEKADVINLSYGIRSGSNIGKSAIDQYIDKMAKEHGVLFSISAGNEGPGLLTIGTPAAADLAITNGAYVSAQTAKDNYGFVGMQDNTIWFFSSVGPRLDGGLKPTLLAPGSALSSVPLWGSAKHANYRGTSMASPQTTGGLALILSAAKQKGLLTDRASVTRAVYDSAKHVAGLSLIEQGHGLMDVIKATDLLSQRTEPTVEYTISVNSPTSPTGKGAGIFVKSPFSTENLFTVAVAPLSQPASRLRTFKLLTEAAWVQHPETLWLEGTNAKTFQVGLDYAKMFRAGINSTLLKAIDEKTKEVAFEVPITVLVPFELSAKNEYTHTEISSIRVGQTLRYFINVPAGATALAVDLESDGPALWAQVLDPEGRTLLDIRDTEATIPLPPLYGNTSVHRAGVYEIDIVAPANNRRPARVTLKVKAHSLKVTSSPLSATGEFDVAIENGFSSVKVVPNLVVNEHSKVTNVSVVGNGTTYQFEIIDKARELYSSLLFEVNTSKKLYDLMTDYPYRVFDSTGSLIASGGLELNSLVELPGLEKLKGNNFALELTGAFSEKAPSQWNIELIEKWELKSPQTLFEGPRLLIESGQTREFTVTHSEIRQPAAGYNAPIHAELRSPDGKLIQRTVVR